MSEITGLDKILILDFGSQYTQLIARRIREVSVYCEIHPYNMPIEQIKKFDPKGIIFSGGPSSVYAEDAPHSDLGIYELEKPILGICYGLQLIAYQTGGKVSSSAKREYGKATITVKKPDKLLANFNENSEMVVWMSHGDKLEQLPENFTKLAHSENSEFAVIANFDKNIYGVQFHPEVVHTIRGTEILQNYVFNICKCTPNWTMRNFIDIQVDSIRKTVADKNLICALSGGIDSSVTAALLYKAIGKQLKCIFVNNGVLRMGEHEKVVRIFKHELGFDLNDIDAEDRFLERLKGVEDPEEKRKIIGNEFIKIFEEEANKLDNVEFLAQGTLYPDVIESVSFKGPSATIKSHHNVGGLPDIMNLKLVEPFKELFKDEVRVIGRELGLPDEVIQRQPFPGPGLAIRILGEVTRERIEILQKADDIVVGEIKKAGWYNKVWQSFAVLLPVQSVGVMGDERTYENVAAIRVVDSKDGMTADWVDMPDELLRTISNRLINEVKGINRVVYDISSKPPSTIEWE